MKTGARITLLLLSGRFVHGVVDVWSPVEDLISFSFDGTRDSVTFVTRYKNEEHILWCQGWIDFTSEQARAMRTAMALA